MSEAVLFSTRTMLRMVEQAKRPRRFLLDLFFGGPPENSMSEYVDIDIYNGKRRMAPFVNPKHEGKLVERTGYTTRTYKPPYVKPKMITTAADIFTRMPGEHAYIGGKTAGQIAAEHLGRDMADLDDQITRREEWMAAQALNGGVVNIVGDGVDDTIDFQMPANHKVTLSGTDLWSDAGSDPIADLRAWKRRVVQTCGIAADAAVFGQDVVNAFLKNDEVKAQLDNRRIDLGTALMQDLDETGAIFIGRFGGVDCFAYDEWYLDENGDEQPMVPVDKVLVGSTRVRTARHYGMIQDVGNMASVDRFPKTWVEQDPSARFIMLQSAPLVVPHQIGGFLTATVL